MPLDDNVLHALATKSILESLTPEMRETLLVRAVQSLFEVPPSTGYQTDKRTRFERSFDLALERASDFVVRDILNEPAYQQAIRDAVSVQIQKLVIGEDREKLSALISSAFDAGMRKLREQY